MSSLTIFYTYEPAKERKKTCIRKSTQHFQAAMIVPTSMSVCVCNKRSGLPPSLPQIWYYNNVSDLLKSVMLVCDSEKRLLKIVLWAIDEELSAFVVILSEMILEEEKKDDVRGNWLHISFIPVSVQMSQRWCGEIFLSCWVTLENDILWCIIIDFTL